MFNFLHVWPTHYPLLKLLTYNENFTCKFVFCVIFRCTHCNKTALKAFSECFFTTNKKKTSWFCKKYFINLVHLVIAIDNSGIKFFWHSFCRLLGLYKSLVTPSEIKHSNYAHNLYPSVMLAAWVNQTLSFWFLLRWSGAAWPERLGKSCDLWPYSGLTASLMIELEVTRTGCSNSLLCLAIALLFIWV